MVSMRVTWGLGLVSMNGTSASLMPEAGVVQLLRSFSHIDRRLGFVPLFEMEMEGGEGVEHALERHAKIARGGQTSWRRTGDGQTALARAPTMKKFNYLLNAPQPSLQDELAHLPPGTVPPPGAPDAKTPAASDAPVSDRKASAPAPAPARSASGVPSAAADAPSDAPPRRSKWGLAREQVLADGVADKPRRRPWYRYALDFARRNRKKERAASVVTQSL